MTKQMLEEYTLSLERQQKKMFIVVWVISILLTLSLAFNIFLIFSTLEFTSEETTTTEYEIDQETGDGNNGANEVIIGDNNKSEESLTVPVCLGIASIGIVVGVLIGKTKNKS